MTIHPAPKPPARAPKPKKGIRRKAQMRKSNAKRRAKRHAIQYGGTEYVEHLHAMPCLLCDATGWTVAAHTATGGIGMKGEADTLVPLCANRWERGVFVEGCHTLLDEKPWLLPEGTEMRLRAMAKQIRAAFLSRPYGSIGEAMGQTTEKAVA